MNWHFTFQKDFHFFLSQRLVLPFSLAKKTNSDFPTFKVRPILTEGLPIEQKMGLFKIKPG
jgi:hypothetical protein